MQAVLIKRGRGTFPFALIGILVSHVILRETISIPYLY
jgi:hypothetical protein